MNHHKSLAALLFFGLAVAAPQGLGQSVYTPYSFIFLAGAPGIGSADGVGNKASFYNPSSVAVDSAGNIYVADSWNHMIRKIAPGAVVTTLAGSTNSGSADGIGGDAQFNYPSSVAVDSAGNIYVADALNHTIRKIAPAAEVTTVAGQAGNFGSADGTGSAAQFNLPEGVAADNAGSIYVADSGNHTIRKITPAGDVTTLAGLAGSPGSTDGIGSVARFHFPTAVAVDTAGNIYVADRSNDTIRKVTPVGIVTTLAGEAGSAGSADGTGLTARFQAPAGIAVDSAGNLFVADSYNATIRKITPDGMVTTLGGVAGTTSDGGTTGVVGYAADGAGSAARFRIPQGVAVDSADNLYVADAWGPTISQGRAVIYTPYTFSTIAGNPGFGSSDGIGSAARFNEPWGIAVDGADNIYVTDYYNFTVRKITPRGVVTTLAGMAGVAARTFAFGSPSSAVDADGTGNTARFGYYFDSGFFGTFSYGPEGLAADSAGNLYVADTPNSTLRKITPAGVVTTLAGFAGAYAGALDGIGSAARFSGLSAVTVDSQGNVYVADSNSHLIRKVTPAGVVTTLAGMAFSAGSADGTNSTARFNNPSGIAAGNSGNLYVADTYNNTIRKVTPIGVVTTLAGLARSSGSTDGTGSAARFSGPWGLAVDAAENIYVADEYNNMIRKITPRGMVTTLAGSTNYGSADGVGNAAQFNIPSAVAVDSVGNVYVADRYNNTVRRVTPSGVVTTVAGLAGGGYGTNDGPASVALFSDPLGVAVDREGNVYVADSDNSTIRRITADGMVTTLAGVANSSGLQDGTNDAARFSQPAAITVDAGGTIYVADTDNSAIRKITPEGVVTTLAGGTSGSADGVGTAAQFYRPHGIAVDSAANLYVADTENNTIRKITPQAVVTTLAGLAGTFGSADGIGSAARFNGPAAVAVDSAGNLYVVEGYNNLLRKVTPAGEVTTLAGCANCPYYGDFDGTGTNASFNSPVGIAIDSAGNIFVSEYYAFTIRKVTPAGVVTTVAGLANSFGSADGTGSAARFGDSFFNGFFYYTEGPSGLAVDTAGNLYVADGVNNIIRKGFPENLAPVVHSASPGFGVYSGQFGFILDGPMGQSAVIEASTNLTQWQPILTNTFAGPLDFNDPQSPLFSRRFYRARIP